MSDIFKNKIFYAYILRWDIITAKAEEIAKLMNAKVALLEPQEEITELPQK